jgi:hypothetical protein
VCCTLRTPTLSNAGGPPQNPLKDGCGRQILMRVVHFEETDEKARAKADSYPLEPHFLEYYGIDEEFVVSTPIGFGSEPRSKGTDNPTRRWANWSVFAQARQFYDFSTENDLTASATRRSSSGRSLRRRSDLASPHGQAVTPSVLCRPSSQTCRSGYSGCR